MKKDRITIRDVAKLVGVSIGTVSNSLNGSAGVGPAVRRRVLAAAAELGYQPNRAAQATRTGRTRTFALVTPDLRHPFYPHLAQAISAATREKNYSLLLVDTLDGDAEREGLEHIARHGVDGILWCPATGTDTIEESALGVPVVVIDHWLPGRDNVSANYRMTGMLLAKLVTEGPYKSVGLISGPLDIPATRSRRDHFLAFLGDRIPVAWEIIHPFDMRLNDEARSAVLSRTADIIICCDDLMAVGALSTALEGGLRVPDDVAIVGHDDLPIASIFRPGVTTIRQPLDMLGREAVRLLIERIENPSLNNRQLLIDVALVERQSTRSKDAAPALPKGAQSKSAALPNSAA